MAPAATGAIATPLAYGLGRQRGNQEALDFLPKPTVGKIQEIGRNISSDIQQHVTPANIAGTGAGALIGALIAQQMRQPMSGHRKVPIARRPSELIPGASAGGLAGLVLANLIQGANVPERELDPYA